MANRSNRGRAHAKLRSLTGKIQQRERQARAQKFLSRAETANRTVSGVKFHDFFYSTPESKRRTLKQRRVGFNNP